MERLKVGMIRSDEGIWHLRRQALCCAASNATGAVAVAVQGGAVALRRLD